jgi:VanZ family protein
MLGTRNRDLKRQSKILLWARFVAWILAIIIVILSVVPPNLRPETGTSHAFEHGAIFFLTGTAFAVGYNRRHGLLAVLLVVFSGAVELAQLFAPGRHARLSDFIIDALAITGGLLTVSLVGRIRMRT